MGTHIVLTKEERNRVDIWSDVLSKVNNYCAVCAEQKDNIPVSSKEEDWEYYNIRGHKSYYTAPFIIKMGLIEAAIIGLGSIFNRSGCEGVGIAANYYENILKVKKELIERTAKKLGYMTDDELDSYIKRIVGLRNQLIAHYDGSTADYCEEYFDKTANYEYSVDKPPEIIKMKAPFVCFSSEEIIQLNKITICMHEALIDFFVEIDNTTST